MPLTRKGMCHGSDNSLPPIVQPKNCLRLLWREWLLVAQRRQLRRIRLWDPHAGAQSAYQAGHSQQCLRTK